MCGTFRYCQIYNKMDQLDFGQYRFLNIIKY